MASQGVGVSRLAGAVEGASDVNGSQSGGSQGAVEASAAGRGSRSAPDNLPNSEDQAALLQSGAQASSSTVSPEPSNWQKPAAYFERRMFRDGALKMPDGVTIPFWGFADPRAAADLRALPSPVIRVREGERVQIKLEMDGDATSTGRTDVKSHIYQWQPKSAGTWLYQSHASSLRQFEMGLFGLLIVDPEPDAGGKPRAYRDGPSYDVERCWVFDDVDPSWHGGGAAGAALTQPPADATFAPKYFLVNGVANVEAHDHPEVAIEARPGDKILLRLLNASFSLMRTRIEGLSGNIISVDGKALAGANRPWSKWSPIAPGQPVYMATGARHDCLIDLGAAANPVMPGQEFLVSFEFLDWSKRAVRNLDAAAPLNIGRATTRIRVV